MKVGICTIAYNSDISLLSMARTAGKGTESEIEFYLFLHSRKPQTVAVCETIRNEFNTYYYPYGVNRGLSVSWNEAIIEMTRHKCNVMLFVNDDVWFTPGDIDRLAVASHNHKDVGTIFCSGFHVGYGVPIGCHGMSCFVLQPIAIETVGFFDENFFPAYDEDVDYARRSIIAGLKSYVLDTTNVHHIGSAAIKKEPELSTQNDITHGANNRYWEQKWGCDITEDLSVGYKTPFNDPSVGIYISQVNRHAPYGVYDRPDIGSVW